MSQCNHLHIMHNAIFTKSFIKFIEKNFNITEHFFIIIGGSSKIMNDFSKKTKKYIIYINNIKPYKINNLRKIYELEVKMYKCKKIHIHSLFNDNLVRFLFFQKWLLKKCNWIVWGGDLYKYKNEKKDFGSNINEYMRSKIINNFKEITTFIPGDYKIVKNVYNTKASYNHALTYDISVDESFIKNLITNSNSNNNKIVFLVGNSANPSNNTIEVLKILSKFKRKDIKIITPLAYGDDEYKNKIINYGNETFKKKYKPLINFYPLKEYLKILSKVDIGIFNHKRQQATGNITKLLQLEKKVFIRSNITSWDFFKNMGVELYDTKKLNQQSFRKIIEFDKKVGKKNSKIIKKIRSEKRRIKSWKKILNR